jgi:hypothetical protein
MSTNNNSNSSKYLNGIFATRKEGQYGEFISIGITDEGIEALQNLSKNGEFRNFTLSPQKSDPNKFSAKPQASKRSDDLPF